MNDTTVRNLFCAPVARILRIVFVGAILLVQVFCAALATYAESPYAIDWSRQFGTLYSDTMSAVNADGLGNIWVTGYINDISGGPSNLQLSSYRYDTVGVQQTAQIVSQPGNEEGLAITNDGSGTAFIVGRTTSSIGGPNAGMSDPFVLRTNASGMITGSTQIGSAGDDYARAASYNSLGFMIAGYTNGNMAGAIGSQDAFVRQYDTSGVPIWTKQFGTVGADQAYGLATHLGTNTIVVGAVSGSIDSQTYVANEDIFVKSLSNLDGSTNWTKMLGTGGTDKAMGVATDTSGNIFVSGYSTGNLDGNTGNGGFDAFLSKYDSSGGLLWTKLLGTSADDQASGVAVDSLGNVFVTGFTMGALDGNIYNGSADLFLTKFDNAGNKLWTEQFGTSSNDRSLGISIDNLDNVFITGYTAGSLFGPISGSQDGFLIKFTAIPEPGSVALGIVAVVGIAAMVRRKK